MKTIDINRRFRLQEKFRLGFACKMRKLKVLASNMSRIFFDYYFDQKLQKTYISADIGFEGASRRVFKFCLLKPLPWPNFLKLSIEMENSACKKSFVLVSFARCVNCKFPQAIGLVYFSTIILTKNSKYPVYQLILHLKRLQGGFSNFGSSSLTVT